MRKSVYSYGTFYGTEILPHYSVDASEIFTVDGKENVLTSSAFKLGSPIRIYFSQDENCEVKYLSIQLSLGLRQISGKAILFDKSYEKKVCKEADKYFNRLMTNFKKKGYDVKKTSKNEFTVTSSDYKVTFENRIHNNFSYGTIDIHIVKNI